MVRKHLIPFLILIFSLAEASAHDCKPLKLSEWPLRSGATVKVESIFSQMNVLWGYKMTYTSNFLINIPPIVEYWTIESPRNWNEKQVSCHLEYGLYFLRAPLSPIIKEIPFLMAAVLTPKVNKRAFAFNGNVHELNEILIAGHKFVLIDELKPLFRWIARIIDPHPNFILSLYRTLANQMKVFPISTQNPYFNELVPLSGQRPESRFLLVSSNQLFTWLETTIPKIYESYQTRRLPSRKRKETEALEAPPHKEPKPLEEPTLDPTPPSIAHLPESEWIVVKQSHYLKKGEFGLYAKKDIPVGTLIAPYRGKVLSKDETLLIRDLCDKNGDDDRALNYVAEGTDSSGDLLFGIDGYLAYQQGICPAAAANHSITPNARLTQIPISKDLKSLFATPEGGHSFFKRQGIALMSIHPIPEGKEILIDYGHDYAESLRKKYGEDADNIQYLDSNVIITRKVAFNEYQKAVLEIKLAKEKQITGKTAEQMESLSNAYRLLERTLFFFQAKAKQENANPSDVAAAERIKNALKNLENAKK